MHPVMHMCPRLLSRLVVPVRLRDFGDSAGYGVIMSEKLTMTIAYDDQDEEGWIVACVLGVPGAISQGQTREEARENVIDALRLTLAPDEAEPAVANGESEHLDLIFAR